MIYHYNVKMIHSGDRTELYYYDLAQQRGREARNKEGRRGKGVADKEKNRKEVLYRARNNIIRLVNCNPDLTSFITMTYAENMTDLEVSKKDLHKCIQILQRNYKNFKYIYVLEFQGRGAIHYHMLCNYPITFECAKSHQAKSPEQKAAENFFMYKYWDSNGFCDIRDLKQEGNTNVGLYVSQYIVKELEETDMEGKRIYGYSRNMLRPIEETMMVHENRWHVMEEMNKYYHINYVSSYQQTIDYGNEIKSGTVNYLDMKRRENP